MPWVLSCARHHFWGMDGWMDGQICHFMDGWMDLPFPCGGDPGPAEPPCPGGSPSLALPAWLSRVQVMRRMQQHCRDVCTN